jgi:hypothetical protein
LRWHQQPLVVVQRLHLPHRRRRNREVGLAALVLVLGDQEAKGALLLGQQPDDNERGEEEEKGDKRLINTQIETGFGLIDGLAKHVYGSMMVG